MTAKPVTSTDTDKEKIMSYLNPHTHRLDGPDADGALRSDTAGTLLPKLAMLAHRDVLAEVAEERARQDARWGEQNHPDYNPADIYTGPAEHAVQADRWKLINAERAARGATAWDGVLLEEVYEALAETDPAKVRAELVQVAAVAVAQIEAIDRREVSR